MNQDMLTISTKFLRIMEMASVELGGFEVRSENESVYVTDNFFSMLGKKELSEKSMTGKDFMEFLDSYNKSCHHTVRGDGSRVYSVIHNSGEIRYVRMEIKTEPDRQIGLVEDVTKVTRERMNIEHHRPRCIGIICHMHRSTGQLPDEPCLNRSEQQLSGFRALPCLWHMI